MDVLDLAQNVADRTSDGIRRMIIRKLIKKMAGEAMGDVNSMAGSAIDGVMCLFGKCKKNPLTKPGW